MILSALSVTEINAAAAWVVSVVALGAAVMERLRSSKKEFKTEREQELLSDAKMFQERGEVFMKAAEENLALYKKEKEEHHATREYWHTKSSEYQATLTNCQSKLTELNLRPDYAEIVRLIQQETETNTKILNSIHELVVLLREKISFK